MGISDRPLQIAIDGPVASGKSTVGEAVARALGILYLDTGIMYRAVALEALRSHISPDDPVGCGFLAETLDLEMLPPTVRDGRQSTVLLHSEDVTWQIRTDEVNQIVSRVSSHPRVRAAMRERQRRIAASRPVVMVGRDIASVVLPNAQVKIFLDATLEERVRRRAAELRARRPDVPIDLDALRAEIVRRDTEDSAQMLLTPDTVIVTTDGMTVDQVVARIVEVASASVS
jgi:cytidylate kinase